MEDENVVLDRKEVLKSFLENKEKLDKRNTEGIEKYRKGDFTLQFASSEKKTIVVEQIAHDFKFGCNAFMIDSFETPEKEPVYKDRFARLFNQAVVPFYWDSLEPEEGKLRFHTDSENVYRRPAPDSVLKFCEEYGIEPKGHCLLWNCCNPSWLEKYSPEERKAIAERRFQQISAEYADKIPSWDIVNESSTNYNPGSKVLFEEWDEIGLRLGGKYFPDNIKILNDTNTGIWYSYPRQGKYMPFNMQLREFLAKKLPFDEIGIQYHMFCKKEAFKDSCFMNCDNLLGVLDIFDGYGLPVHLSEITIPSFWGAIKENEELQAELAEICYKTFFATKNMKSIVWWNLVDGYAAWAKQNTPNGENYYAAGLLHYDMSEKPVYKMLDRLINEEWKTKETVTVYGNAFRFRGFYGEYKITVETESGKQSVNVRLSKDGQTEIL